MLGDQPSHQAASAETAPEADGQTDSDRGKPEGHLDLPPGLGVSGHQGCRGSAKRHLWDLAQAPEQDQHEHPVHEVGDARK